MSISITQGKALLFPLVVPLSNGGFDTTTALTSLGTNQATNLKVLMNPSNPREVGVLALAPTSGAEVTAIIGGFTATVTVSVPSPTINGASFGTPGAEISPPSWLA